MPTASGARSASSRTGWRGSIYSNERVFGEFRDMLPQSDAKKIHDALLQARVALADEKRAALEAAIYDLGTVSRTLSDVMLTRTGGQGSGKG